MGTPIHPPCCPGAQHFQHLMPVWPPQLLGQHLFIHVLNPAIVSPRIWAITNLNGRAHFSSIWTDPSVFSTGGLSFQSWGNLPRQPLSQNQQRQIVPWRLGPMWEHHWAAWSRQKLKMWFSRRKCSPSIDWQLSPLCWKHCPLSYYQWGWLVSNWVWLVAISPRSESETQ